MICVAMYRRPWPPEIPSTPPAWCEQEWCDDGATCEHPECLDRLQELTTDPLED